MKKNPDLKVEIDGHTDSTGTAAYNMALSEKRAKAVKKYFVDQGIAPNRMTTKGLVLQNRPPATKPKKAEPKTGGLNLHRFNKQPINQ